MNTYKLLASGETMYVRIKSVLVLEELVKKAREEGGLFDEKGTTWYNINHIAEISLIKQ